MQRHIRNDSSEAVRPVQLWDSAVRANMSGPSSQKAALTLDAVCTSLWVARLGI